MAVQQRDYTFGVDPVIQAQMDSIVASTNHFGGELELVMALLLALEKHGAPGSRLRAWLLHFLNHE